MQPQWSDLARLVNEEKREVYLKSPFDERHLVLGIFNSLIFISKDIKETLNWKTTANDFTFHIQELIREDYTIEPLEEPKAERWVPKVGQEYFYCDDCGSGNYSHWEGDRYDLFRLSVGNVHRTEKDAIEYRERWVKLMGENK